MSGKGVIFLNLNFNVSNEIGIYLSNSIIKFARSELSLVSVQLITYLRNDITNFLNLIHILEIF